MLEGVLVEVCVGVKLVVLVWLMEGGAVFVGVCEGDAEEVLLEVHVGEFEFVVVGVEEAECVVVGVLVTLPVLE